MPNMPQNGISVFFEVAGPKMARFLKNEFFCDLHAYFQDLNGRETLADQKWEMLPTLLTM